jgi:hypothetical protein
MQVKSRKTNPFWLTRSRETAQKNDRLRLRGFVRPQTESKRYRNLMTHVPTSQAEPSAPIEGSELGLNVEQISAIVVDAAIHVHKELGPGLLETVYEVVLARMLQSSSMESGSMKGCAWTFSSTASSLSN